MAKLALIDRLSTQHFQRQFHCRQSHSRVFVYCSGRRIALFFKLRDCLHEPFSGNSDHGLVQPFNLLVATQGAIVKFRFANVGSRVALASHSAHIAPLFPKLLHVSHAHSPLPLPAA